MKFRVVGIIPARGGSKGVPHKNIALIGGRPLLAYTAETALRARRLSRVLLSTDDPVIAEVGRQHGIESPFLRPSELASDDAPTLPVLQHAVRFLENHGDRYDAICLLQPTCPLRLPEHIDECIELADQSKADSVVSVSPVPHEYNPYWTYWRDSEGYLQRVLGESAPMPRRQQLPPAFHRDGSIYVTRRDVLMNGNSLYGERCLGHVVYPQRCVNIDTPDDLARAEVFIAGAGR